MKILKKALISFSIILLNTTKVFATTEASYVSETNSGIGKFLLFIVAIGLISLVLFIGYKMDKNEAQEKRKEKIIKQRDNNMYSNVYTTYDNIKEVEEKEEEIPKINFAPVTEEYFKDVENDMTQKIDVVEEDVDTNSVSEVETNKVEEFLYEEVEEDGYTEENDVYESEDFGETQVISLDEEEEDDEEEFDSTVVFDTGPLKNIDVNMDVEEKITNKMTDIKGYDYEDNDMDLLELEQTIAEANIKKYTRDKNQEMIKVKRVSKKKESKNSKKEDKNIKKYTRKKETSKKEVLEDEKKESTVKRYKTKKKTTPKENKNEKNNEEIKSKKYTKVKDKKENAKKTEDKVENDEKPKRGRKPKAKVGVEETVKKTKNTSTKK